MRITGTTSTITFDMEDGHIMKAKGELLINKTFVVDKNSMERWEPPFENECLTKEDIDRIISMVRGQVNENTVQLVFE